MHPLTLALIVLIALSACSTPHNTLVGHPKTDFRSYQWNQPDSLYYGKTDDLLAGTSNKRIIRWARRKHYHFVGLEVMNTSTQFRKGFQLSFYDNDKLIQLIRNQWVAKKARQKGTRVSLIAMPFYLLESIWRSNLNECAEDGSQQSDVNTDDKVLFTEILMESDTRNRNKANGDLAKELAEYDFSEKVLPAGKPVYGVIVFSGKQPPTNLQVRIQP